MKTRLMLLLLFFSVTFGQGIAQNRMLRAADLAFESYQYNIASAKYRKALTKARTKPEKDEIAFKIAECYRLINNTKKSEPAYKRIIKSNYAEKNPLTYLYYAQACKSNEKWAEAKMFFEKYAAAVPGDIRGKTGAESCDLAEDWLHNPTKTQVKLEKTLNSKESDFSPTYADKLYNTIIFTSTRQASTGKSTDDWTGQSFSDLYITKVDPKGAWSTPVLLETNSIINTPANEGNPAVNSKFNQMYFTRCGNDRTKVQGCQIMVSRRAGRIWGDPVPVDLGGDSVTVIGNPTISPDDLMLVFSSDLPNGNGGKDIWYATRRSAQENFNRPKNIGQVINTSGDEMFPFLRNDTTLYFASNGHPGMGGLDIFRSIYRNGEWTEPVNLQAPVNSPADDFAIVFNPEEDKGFFASNRKGGRGSDDLYSFFNPPLLFTLQGSVKDDKTLQLIQGVTIRLTGSDGSSLETKTDVKGHYGFGKYQIKPKTSYELLALKNGYFNKKAKETTVGLESSKDLTVDFKLIPIPDKPIVLPDILYDLAKWDLKPQYQDSLQGLIKTLDENETIIIELASHTDNRSSDEYNDVLSQKRAESVVNYLIERGIDPLRLRAKGYGERVPRTLTKNITKDGYFFKIGTVLTGSYIDSLPTKPMQEAAHSLNRRSEFKILSKDFVPKTQNAPISSQNQVQGQTTKQNQGVNPPNAQIPVQQQNANPQAPAVTIQINPDDNIIPYTTDANNVITFNAVVNGYTTRIKYAENANGITFSMAEALRMLKNGSLTKMDFGDQAEKVLSNNNIADNAAVNIAEMTIANKSAFDLEASVSQKQMENVVMGQKILKKFGSFTIDKEKKLIIFKK